MRNVTPPLLIAATLCACVGPGDAKKRVTLVRGSELVEEGDLAAGYRELADALEAGYPKPSEILASATWQPLLHDKGWRAQTRDLLKRFARESAITMVHHGEPGEPLHLEIRLVDETHGTPVPDALVELVHTDAAGFYQPWTPDEMWNPRLFGYAKSDRAGLVRVRTIRPGYDAAEYDADEEPAHVHFGIEREGYRPYHAEFLFEDDPRLIGEPSAEAKRKRLPIATVRGDENVGWNARVTLRLQPRR